MQPKIMFIFSFRKRKPKDVTRINRQLFGYTDKSNNGKYVYKRDGILTKYDIQRVAKGVFLTYPKFQNIVTKTLKKTGAKEITKYSLWHKPTYLPTYLYFAFNRKTKFHSNGEWKRDNFI